MTTNETTLYRIGRSKYNTVKIIKNDYGYELQLTENGGRYSFNCLDTTGIFNRLAVMWGMGVFADITFDECKEKILKKLVLVSGVNVLND